MKQKSTLLRRVLSMVLSFALVLPATLALIGDSGSAEAAGTKTSINVLSIEPSDQHLLTAATVTSWGYTGAVNITYVSSLEFSACIENLQENYDLIYVGDNGGSTSGLRLDSSYLYANIGETSSSRIPLNGVGLTDSEYISTRLVSPYNSYYDLVYQPLYTRYSGNDLTPVQLDALNNYALAGRPVIYGNGLTNGTVRKASAAFRFTVDVSASVIGNAQVKLDASARATSGTLPSFGPSSYQWSNSSGSIAGATSATYTASVSGSYYCTITYTIDSIAYTARSNSYTCTITTENTTISNNTASATTGSFFGSNSFSIVETCNRSQTTQNTPINVRFTTTITPNSSLPGGTRRIYAWYKDSYIGGVYSTTTLANNSSTSNSNNYTVYPNINPGSGNYDIYYCRVHLQNSSNTVISSYGYSNTFRIDYYSPSQITISSSTTNSLEGRYTSVSFTAGVTPTSGSSALPITLTAAPSNSSYDTDYLWYSDDPLVSGSTNASVTIDSSSWANNTNRYYYCQVTLNSGTFGTANSNTVTLSHTTLSASYVTGTGQTTSLAIPAVTASNFTINTSTVDDCSNMFAFLDENKSRPNIMRWNSSSPSDIDRQALQNAINLSKPIINLSWQPTVYTGVGGPSLSADVGSNPATYTLRYDFTITNETDSTPAATNYYCYLAIDSDADGTYTTAERVANVVIKKASDSSLVTSGNLKADTAYVATHQLPSGTIGIIPWKLEVIKTTDESAHASAVNYTRVPVSAGKAKIIDILQINTGFYTSNGSIGGNPGLSLDNTNGNPYSFSSSFYSSWNTFDGLFSQISSDYDINIQTVTTDEIQAIGTTAITNKLAKDTSGDYTNLSYSNASDLISSYNMVILGVGGTRYDLAEATATALSDYLQSGGAVLFTHDTSSIINLPYAYEATYYPTFPYFQANRYYGTVPVYGYYFNTYLRSRLGLDRFGVMDDSFGHTNKSNPSLATSGLVASNAYASMTQAQADALIAAGYSIAYLPGSSKATPVTTTQGFSDYVYSSNSATTISQVNEGQITCYPFNINSGNFDRAVGASAAVSSTHAQYYQLNMNSADVKVWYCLENSSDFKHNDASNAPYIYRRGSATFSNFGNTYQYLSNSAETQLFVNTIIAASGVSRVAPDVKFSDITGNKVVANCLLPADSYGVLNTSGATSTDRNLYFTITDNNSGFKTISAQISYGPSGDQHSIPTTVYNSQTGAQMGANSLESGLPYYVKIDDVWASLPAAIKDDIDNGIPINVTVTTTIGGVSLSATTTVKFRKLMLFELS